MGGIQGTPVSLEEMLTAREWRVALQQHALQGANDKTLVCFTLNISGPVKAFSLAERTFHEGEAGIHALLQSEGVAFESIALEKTNTGYMLLLLAALQPVPLKKLLCQLEDNHPLGRLFDIDVIAETGKVGREALSMPERTCLLCDRPAFECGRSRRHTVEALQRQTLRIMENYFQELEATKLSAFATRALLYEVAVSPKPGLVDRFNNGSHQDMNFYTFMDSASVLSDYFKQVAKAGLTATGSPAALFERCRYLGRMAEARMYASTDRVNTHKGAIFSMGILCAAAGFVFAQTGEYTEEALIACVRQMTAAQGQTLESVTHPKTAGERAFLEYGCGGIREEACKGFPSVFQVALPVLRQMMEQTADRDQAGCAAILHLMACVDDTCLLKRGGYEEFIRQREALVKTRDKLGSYERLIPTMKALDEEYIAKNLSAGGCADLMAATWFVYFVTTEQA